MKGDQIFNIVLGLNIIAWGILGLVEHDEPHLTLVRVCIVLLNLLVGTLIVFRRTSLRPNTHYETLICLPAFLFSGLLFYFAAPLESWQAPAQTVFVSGAALTAVSFLFLGRSFGIRPAHRQLIQAGPYQLVRHPAYLGEFLIGFGCLLSQPGLPGILSICGLIIFQVLRIKAEEQSLGSSADHAAYVGRTRWRLIPYLW